MSSLLVADETLAVAHMFSPFTGREVDLVDVHDIGISGGTSDFHWLGLLDIACPSSLEFPESYHISVKLSCLIEPLFTFPSSLFLSSREGSSSHHNSKLIGYPLLEGVNQNAVEIDSTTHLSQSESSGVLVKVSVELVHGQGIDSLAG